MLYPIANNAARCSVTVSCQILIDLLLASIMRSEITYYQIAHRTDGTLTKIFGEDADQKLGPMDVGFYTGVGILLGAIAPAVADIVTAASDKTSSS
jgi:hypothetical protein